jgi:hypothetical protein
LEHHRDLLLDRVDDRGADATWLVFVICRSRPMYWVVVGVVSEVSVPFHTAEAAVTTMPLVMSSTSWPRRRRSCPAAGSPARRTDRSWTAAVMAFSAAERSTRVGPPGVGDDVARVGEAARDDGGLLEVAVRRAGGRRARTRWRKMLSRRTMSAISDSYMFTSMAPFARVSAAALHVE